VQVTTRTIRNWAEESGIPDLTPVELSFRRVHALQAVYLDPSCVTGCTSRAAQH